MDNQFSIFFKILIFDIYPFKIGVSRFNIHRPKIGVSSLDINWLIINFPSFDFHGLKLMME